MSYLDELQVQVEDVFDQAADQEDLQEKVLELIQAKAKESFLNGLEAARKKSKGQKAKQA